VGRDRRADILYSTGALALSSKCRIGGSVAGAGGVPGRAKKGCGLVAAPPGGIPAFGAPPCSARAASSSEWSWAKMAPEYETVPNWAITASCRVCIEEL